MPADRPPATIPPRESPPRPQAPQHKAEAQELVGRSDDLGALFSALSKAQGQMATAHKDKQNPHFRSSYADLASCWDACRVPLAANGLCVLQLTEPHPKAAVVVTILGHGESGQWVSARTAVPTDKPTAHGLGAATTYARRYGLSALLGIAPAEDDGNSASGLQPQGRR